MHVHEATRVTPELVEAFARLTPQLSKSSPPPTEAELTEMVDAASTHVLVAIDDQHRVVGTLTLVVFRIPTGIRAWIEDVVVDESAGRQGIGSALTTHALDIARANGAKTVDLTSRPSREAANRLYQRLGFTLRETNVWRLSLWS